MGQNKNNDYPPSTLVGAKRVKTEKDSKGRDRLYVTFGPDSNGVNGAQQLANAISELANAGKQFNLDFRVGEAEANGRTFPTCFVIVKEMVPKSGGTSTFTAKGSRTDQLKADAERIKAEVEG